MDSSPSQTPTPAAEESDADQQDYWCYNCNKLVSVEAVENLPDVYCNECQNGFVEILPSDTDRAADSSFSEYVRRILSQVTREDEGDPPPPHDPQSEDDFSGGEPSGLYSEEEDDDDDDDENESEEIEGGNEDGDDAGEGNIRRYYRESLLRRARNLARIEYIESLSDEIRLDLGGTAMELRFGLSDSGRYRGNPDDYIGPTGLEELLQHFAESDIGRKGAPPAAKSVILGLPTVEILSETEASMCAICKDSVGVGELIKKLPCGHGYHGDCILPWLNSRNSCPVCRFELPTDDTVYEEQRRKKVLRSAGEASASGGDNSS